VRFDYIDGRRVPQTEIAEDYTLVGTHNGSVRVIGGAFKLVGTLNGSLEIGDNLSVEILGKQNGSVWIGSGSSVFVAGEINGSLSLARGGMLVVKEGAKLAGSLQNDGLVVLRGTFGGSQSGTGELQIDGGTIKQPIKRDGIDYYEW
jgi:hypothetical protein